MIPEHQALKAQDKAEKAKDDFDFESAAANYRTAAAIWLQIGDMDQYERCLSAADDMDEKVES